MQYIQALDVRLSKGKTVRCEVTADSLKRLSSEAACVGEAVALLFADAELDAFVRETAGLVVRRGVKNPNKQLAYYFHSHGGIVALDAAYAVAGQALRGVRALLAKLRDEGRPKLCLIGLPKRVFDELRADAEAAPESGVRPAGGVDLIAHLEALLRAGGCLECAVPDELEEAFVGTSRQTQIVRQMVLCAARTSVTVLIEGPSGTGKEIVARQIHEHSVRKSGRFIVANCGAIPTALFESELFGHEKGAYTGATNKRSGLWAMAEGGTIFLDEIGDLAPENQVKVLRALDGYGTRAVGSDEERKTNARVIAATNRDLAAMVRENRFREDLYYRLFAFRIRTCPLAQRVEDIPPLARHFWRAICSPAHADTLTLEALDELKGWVWPGNARELKAFLANTYALACGKPVTAELIREVIRDRLGPRVVLLADQDR